VCGFLQWDIPVLKTKTNTLNHQILVGQKLSVFDVGLIQEVRIIAKIWFMDPKRNFDSLKHEWNVTCFVTKIGISESIFRKKKKSF
jgi:hypothetical protein